ncbi:hypothetical protein MMC07_004729 [Pseudocyphellaria aurata]|nr:hypothetical protein [Pseudocyphellaria aurata]
MAQGYSVGPDLTADPLATLPRLVLTEEVVERDGAVDPELDPEAGVRPDLLEVDGEGEVVDVAGLGPGLGERLDLLEIDEEGEKVDVGTVTVTALAVMEALVDRGEVLRVVGVVGTAVVETRETDVAVPPPRSSLHNEFEQHLCMPFTR